MKASRRDCCPILAEECPAESRAAQPSGNTGCSRRKALHHPWDEPAPSEEEPFTVEQPGLFACYQAAALLSGSRASAQPTLRVLAGEGAAGTANDTEVREEPVAEALGVDVYAKQSVDGRDRAQLERLYRSCDMGVSDTRQFQCIARSSGGQLEFQAPVDAGPTPMLPFRALEQLEKCRSFFRGTTTLP